MVYVERRGGKIAGVYANLQEGYAEEEMADDAPEVVAFLNPPVIVPPVVPIPQLVTVSLLQVVDEEVFTVGVSAGVAFAMRMDAGLIWVFFSQEMPDLNYSYSYTVTPSSGRATVTDRQLNYMEITVSDNDGQPIDPAEISVQVYRATL